jgi:hypothetical protein
MFPRYYFNPNSIRRVPDYDMPAIVSFYYKIKESPDIVSAVELMIRYLKFAKNAFEDHLFPVRIRKKVAEYILNQIDGSEGRMLFFAMFDMWVLWKVLDSNTMSYAFTIKDQVPPAWNIVKYTEDQQDFANEIIMVAITLLENDNVINAP